MKAIVCVALMSIAYVLGASLPAIIALESQRENQEFARELLFHAGKIKPDDGRPQNL